MCNRALPAAELKLNVCCGSGCRTSLGNAPCQRERTAYVVETFDAPASSFANINLSLPRRAPAPAWMPP